MIIGAIIVGILIFALIILIGYIRDRWSGSFEDGLFIASLIIILIIIEVCLLNNIKEKLTPSALDVYRGNTELEITSVNGIPIDTVVVFKKENNYEK